MSIVTMPPMIAKSESRLLLSTSLYNLTNTREVIVKPAMIRVIPFKNRNQWVLEEWGPRQLAIIFEGK